MTIKFVHAADIHLDSPLRGLERYEGAPTEYVRTATRQAFINLVDLCLAEQVNFLLIAGDLYDGDWRDYGTGLFFNDQMRRLREAGVRVYLVRGNHDADSQITRSLRLPDNVWSLATDEPETILLDDVGVAIHGQGFRSRSVTDDLSAAYPDPVADYFNIGLLHTCADGREGHAPYAPCSLSNLIAQGYDYWALGHVHTRELLHTGGPWVIFPGNTQGRHIREPGAKGCSLITLADGRVESVDHHDLDVLRWTICRVDASDLGSPLDVIDLARELAEAEIAGANGRISAMRFVITGASPINQELRTNPEHWINNLRSEVNEAARGEAWVEKVQIQTTRKATLQELQSQHPVGYLLNFLAELPNSEEIVEKLSAELKDLQKTLPPELFAQHQNLDFRNPAARRLILGDVEEFLITRLLAKGVVE